MLQVFENVTGTDLKDPVIPGALFWHVATPEYASWDPYAICYSDEIRNKLKALGAPGTSSRSSVVDATKLKPGKRELEMVTESNDATESWEIMKLCWDFAGKLVPKPQGKLSDALTADAPAMQSHESCCGLVLFLKAVVRRLLNCMT